MCVVMVLVVAVGKCNLFITSKQLRIAAHLQLLLPYELGLLSLGFPLGYRLTLLDGGV
jgi:hypothetical protein